MATTRHCESSCSSDSYESTDSENRPGSQEGEEYGSDKFECGPSGGEEGVEETDGWESPVEVCETINTPERVNSPQQTPKSLPINWCTTGGGFGPSTKPNVPECMNAPCQGVCGTGAPQTCSPGCGVCSGNETTTWFDSYCRPIGSDWTCTGESMTGILSLQGECLPRPDECSAPAPPTVTPPPVPTRTPSTLKSTPVGPVTSTPTTTTLVGSSGSPSGVKEYTTTKTIGSGLSSKEGLKRFIRAWNSVVEECREGSSSNKLTLRVFDDGTAELYAEMEGAKSTISVPANEVSLFQSSFSCLFDKTVNEVSVAFMHSIVALKYLLEAGDMNDELAAWVTQESVKAAEGILAQHPTGLAEIRRAAFYCRYDFERKLKEKFFNNYKMFTVSRLIEVQTVAQAFVNEKGCFVGTLKLLSNDLARACTAIMNKTCEDLTTVDEVDDLEYVNDRIGYFTHKTVTEYFGECCSSSSRTSN